MAALFSAPNPPQLPLPPRPENPEIAARDALRNARIQRTRSSFIIPTGLITQNQSTPTGLGNVQNNQ